MEGKGRRGGRREGRGRVGEEGKGRRGGRREGRREGRGRVGEEGDEDQKDIF